MCLGHWLGRDARCLLVLVSGEHKSCHVIVIVDARGTLRADCFELSTQEELLIQLYVLNWYIIQSMRYRIDRSILQFLHYEHYTWSQSTTHNLIIFPSRPNNLVTRSALTELSLRDM